MSPLILTKRNRVVYAIARKLYSRKLAISAAEVLIMCLGIKLLEEPSVFLNPFPATSIRSSPSW